MKLPDSRWTLYLLALAIAALVFAWLVWKLLVGLATALLVWRLLRLRHRGAR